MEPTGSLLSAIGSFEAPSGTSVTGWLRLLKVYWFIRVMVAGLGVDTVRPLVRIPYQDTISNVLFYY